MCKPSCSKFCLKQLDVWLSMIKYCLFILRRGGFQKLWSSRSGKKIANILRQQLFESFREYLIKVSQTPKHGLSIETQAQLKSILNYDARISEEFSSLLLKENEYHNRYLQKHPEQSPLRDLSMLDHLVKRSEKVVVEASDNNKEIMKKQVDNFSKTLIQKFLIYCSNQHQQKQNYSKNLFKLYNLKTNSQSKKL